MKTKLINGRIYDGNGGKPFYGELAFADDTILAVGTICVLTLLDALPARSSTASLIPL